MATVNLRLGLPPAFQDTFVVAWTIVNADLEIVASGSFFDQNTASAPLPPGRYWARVQLPGSQTKSKSFQLESDAASETLNFDFSQTSRRNWLGWAAVSEAARLVEDSRAQPALQDLWVRAWLRDQGKWSSTQEAVAATVMKDDGVLQLELPQRQPQILAIQLGGAAVPSRVLVIPGSGVTRVLISTTPPQEAVSALEASEADPIHVVVSMQNSIADHLARYLTRGSAGVRQAIDDTLLGEKGLELMEGKRKDPVGAAVGGYFLLQVGEKAPQAWLRNLASYEWLADGAVLYAYSLLRSGRSGVTEAMDHLVKAVRRGYPALQRGVDLFLDACMMIESSQIALPPELQKGVRLYAAERASATGQGAFTSFFGEGPDAPRALTQTASRQIATETVLPASAAVEFNAEGMRALARGEAGIQASREE